MNKFIFSGIGGLALLFNAVNLSANTITQAEYVLDDAPAIPSTGIALSVEKPVWAVISETLDVSSLEQGTHSLNLRVKDAQGTWSDNYAMPLQIIARPTLAVNGQANVLTGINLAIAESDKQSLEALVSGGSSDDGDVWGIYQTTSQVNVADLGNVIIKLDASDAYLQSNDTIKQSLYLSAERFSGESRMATINVVLNGEPLGELTKKQFGSWMLVEFNEPQALNALSNVELLATDWQDATTELSKIHFAFMDANKDKIDDRFYLEADNDNDGAGNSVDAFIDDPAASADSDSDGRPDSWNESCDQVCQTSSSLTLDLDDDNDGYSDLDEISALTNPLDSNSVPTDNDSDFISDHSDPDDDNDGVNDISDAFPYDGTETVDSDGDLLGNNADPDDDNDGVLDENDDAPLNPDVSDLTMPVISGSTSVVLFVSDINGVSINHEEIQAFINGVTATDNIDGRLPVSHNIPSQIEVGTTQVTFTAIDNAGFEATKQASITVSLEGDTDAPVVVTPLPVVFEATGQLTPVELIEPMFTDKYPEQVVISVNNTGPYPLGETSLLWTLTDSEGNSATAMQVLRLVDTSAPSFEELAPLTMAATANQTDFDITDVDLPEAADLVDANVSITLKQEYRFAPGVNSVIWVATDASGNSAEAQQQVNVNPIANFAVDSFFEVGSDAGVRVILNGDAAVYPVRLAYGVAGSASLSGHDATSGEIIIASGRETQLAFSLFDNGNLVEGDIIAFNLIRAENAVLGESTTHDVTVISSNEAPMVSLTAIQGGDNSQIVFNSKGDVIITADVKDLNNVDIANGHTYRWSSSDANIMDSDNNENTFTFNPANLSAGSYELTITVDENRSDEPLSSTNTLRIVVEETLISLAPLNDSDNDGVFDLDEGLGDSDGDGIADYLDNNSDTSLLTVADDNAPLQTLPGLIISVGQTALASEGASVKDSSLTFAQLADNGGEQGSSAQDAQYDDFKPLSYLVDFEVKGLTLAGSVVPIVLPLPDGVVLPQHAVYRKFSNAQGWHSFSADGVGNKIASAKKVDGHCPPPSSDDYIDGLHEGDHCVRLTIKDGGVYDNDASANGTVKDPGYIAVQNLAPVVSVARTNITVDENTVFTLDGSASYDLENDALTFVWKQLSGTHVLDDTPTASVDVIAPSVTSNETLTFELSVSDGNSVVLSEQVTVNVSAINLAPVVSVAKTSISVDANTVFRLDGSASYDPENDALTFVWKQLSGTHVLDDTNTASLYLTAPNVTSSETLTFELSVSDGGSVVSTEQVTVNVSAIIAEPTVTPEPAVESGGSGGGGAMEYLLILLSLVFFRMRFKL